MYIIIGKFLEKYTVSDTCRVLHQQQDVAGIEEPLIAQRRFRVLVLLAYQ